MSANDYMLGGNHYKEVAGEEHWDRIWRLYGRGYFVGCATKYLERYHLKNGKQDLLKAKHFIEKLIELEYPNATERVPTIGQSNPLPSTPNGSGSDNVTPQSGTTPS